MQNAVMDRMTASQGCPHPSPQTCDRVTLNGRDLTCDYPKHPEMRGYPTSQGRGASGEDGKGGMEASPLFGDATLLA